MEQVKPTPLDHAVFGVLNDFNKSLDNPQADKLVQAWYLHYVQPVIHPVVKAALEKEEEAAPGPKRVEENTRNA